MVKKSSKSKSRLKRPVANKANKAKKTYKFGKLSKSVIEAWAGSSRS